MEKTCKCGNTFTTESDTRRRCPECHSSYLREWRKRNKDLGIRKPRTRTPTDTTRAYQREYKKRNREKAKQWDNNARSKLKSFLTYLLRTATTKSKHQCSLSIDDLWNLWEKQCGRCAITNMVMHHRPNDLMSVSIDRIDSSLEYTSDNIHLVCRWVNFAKHHHPISTIKEILENYKNSKE